VVWGTAVPVCHTSVRLITIHVLRTVGAKMLLYAVAEQESVAAIRRTVGLTSR